MRRWFLVSLSGLAIGAAVAIAATVDAANGCAAGQSQLLHRVSGSGPDYCRITPNVCQQIGYHSRTYVPDSNPPFLPTVLSQHYVVEAGGASTFPACSADLSNGPFTAQ